MLRCRGVQVQVNKTVPDNRDCKIPTEIISAQRRSQVERVPSSGRLIKCQTVLLLPFTSNTKIKTHLLSSSPILIILGPPHPEGTWVYICCKSPNQQFCRKVDKERAKLGHSHLKRRRITVALSGCSAAFPMQVCLRATGKNSRAWWSRGSSWWPSLTRAVALWSGPSARRQSH